MSKARPTTTAGGRRLSEAHRDKLRAAGRAQFERMTPEQRAAQVARIGRKPKAGDAAAGSSSVSTPPPASSDPPASTEGRRSPLAMTPLEFVRSLRGRQG